MIDHRTPSICDLSCVSGNVQRLWPSLKRKSHFSLRRHSTISLKTTATKYAYVTWVLPSGKPSAIRQPRARKRTDYLKNSSGGFAVRFQLSSWSAAALRGFLGSWRHVWMKWAMGGPAQSFLGRSELPLIETVQSREGSREPKLIPLPSKPTFFPWVQRRADHSSLVPSASPQKCWRCATLRRTPV